MVRGGVEGSGKANARKMKETWRRDLWERNREADGGYAGDWGSLHVVLHVEEKPKTKTS